MQRVSKHDKLIKAVLTRISFPFRPRGQPSSVLGRRDDTSPATAGRGGAGAPGDPFAVPRPRPGPGPAPEKKWKIRLQWSIRAARGDFPYRPDLPR
jgi:hypothetical protein